MRSARFCMLLLSILALATIAGAGALRAQAAPTPADHPPVPTTTATRQGYSVFKGTVADMTWPEVKAAAAADALVLVPVGVIEEHGPHLSLGTDTYLAYRASTLLQQALAARGVRAVVAPPVYWGVMQLQETGAYPGSFTVRPETMHALLYDVLSDLKRWGFRKVFVLNLHGDRIHRGVVNRITALARDSLGFAVFDPAPGARKRPPMYQYRRPQHYEPDYHAGAGETAFMLRYFPEEVNPKLARTLKPENGFHPLGYAGDPAGYDNVITDALGKYIDAFADDVATWVKAGVQAPTTS